MPNSVKSYPNKPPSVLVASESRIIAILGNSHCFMFLSVALPACHPLLLCSPRRDTFVKAGSPSGLSALALRSVVCPSQEWPGPRRARLWVVPPSGLGSLIHRAAAKEFRVVAEPLEPALSTLAGSPGSSTTIQLGPLGKRRAVGLPPPTQAHSGIHTRPIQSAPGPRLPACPCPTWQRIGFLRCRDPVLLPLIKLLSGTGLVVWVSSLLMVGSARGLCSRDERWEGGDRSWGSGLLQLLPILSPHTQPPKEAQRGVPAFPEGSRKGWKVQTIGACRGTPWVSGLRTAPL